MFPCALWLKQLVNLWLESHSSHTPVFPCELQLDLRHSLVSGMAQVRWNGEAGHLSEKTALWCRGACILCKLYQGGNISGSVATLKRLQYFFLIMCIMGLYACEYLFLRKHQIPHIWHGCWGPHLGPLKAVQALNFWTIFSSLLLDQHPDYPSVSLLQALCIQRKDINRLVASWPWVSRAK